MQADFGANLVIPGEITPTVSTWTQLVTASATSKCARVRLNAPSTSTNATSVLVIVKSDGIQPTTNAGHFELPATATGLNYLHVRDASFVWIKTQTTNDKVEYSIEA